MPESWQRSLTAPTSNRAARGPASGRPPAFAPEIYRNRNVVERCFNKLKSWRGIAMRSDKTARSNMTVLLPFIDRQPSHSAAD